MTFTVPELRIPLPAPGLAAGARPQRPRQSARDERNNEVTTNTLQIPLNATDGKWILVEGPWPITEENWAMMMRYFEIAKPALVIAPAPVDTDAAVGIAPTSAESPDSGEAQGQATNSPETVTSEVRR